MFNRTMVMVLLLALVGWVAPLKTSAQTEIVFKYESTTEPQVVYKPYTTEIKKKVIKRQVGYCSCVIYARSITGYNNSVGNARNWPKNSKVPVVGGVVVTNESRVGHVAVITAVYPDKIEVQEANYSRCRKTTRTISLNSPVIKGFWQG